MTPQATNRAELTLPNDKEIHVTRVFDAPRALVWKAWNTPELIKRWWGGERGTVTSAEVDLRVGGAWRFVMTTAEGGHEVAFHGEFREISEPERLVNTEVYEMPGAPPLAAEDEPVNTINFVDLPDGRTRVEVTTRCSTTELRDLIVGSGMESGMQESYDALERVAQGLAAA